jgi:tRNA (guanine-N7-)-methyltransferase
MGPTSGDDSGSPAARQPGGRRAVRSFVLRGGRLTEGQKRALDELWPRYGVGESAGVLDFADLFGNRAPVIAEIGFGNGESTWRMAASNPDQNFLGIEVHRPGVGHLLMKVREHRLENVRVACADAVAFLHDCVGDCSLAGVRLYFPDPWPKKRHYKRRIVQPDFVTLLARKMRPGGVLHMASDWVPYAEYMLQVMNECAAFENCAPEGGYSARPGWRPQTKYEARGQRLGHRVHDLIFRRKG